MRLKFCSPAETEKYAHVTFFFNGGQEKQFPLEDRCLVPSPKVATYDLQPEMSCHGVAEKVGTRREGGGGRGRKLDWEVGGSVMSGGRWEEV